MYEFVVHLGRRAARLQGSLYNEPRYSTQQAVNRGYGCGVLGDVMKGKIEFVDRLLE